MRTLAFVFAIAGVANAADPIFQVSAPAGSWVRYEGTLTIDKAEQLVRYLVKAGEQESRGGQEMQWIDLIALDPQVQEDKPQVHFRLLIPQVEFGAGKDPLMHASEVTVQYGEGPSRNITGIAEVDPPFAFALSGPSGDSQTLDAPEAVDWQRGKLVCNVCEGESSRSFGPLKYQMQHHILRNQEVPFEMASVRQETVTQVSDQSQKVVLSIQVVDFHLGSQPVGDKAP